MYLKPEAGLASCMKHFPGDGLDERDQHVVTTDNLMSCEEGDREFGKNTLQDGSSVQSGADSRGSDAETLGGCGGLP